MFSMNNPYITKCKRSLFPFGIAFLLSCSSSTTAGIAQEPLFLVKGARPLVMLAVSVDHKLFQKAYPDYSDLTNDGVLDISYTDSFDYYGYFDNRKCYVYDAGDGRFEPTATTPSGTYSHHCGTTEWSGNFLNWATMTRVDLLRKVLYGGKRFTDTSSDTVLERALIPTDIHAFSKVFTASSTIEMQSFTPYAKTTLSICNVTTQTDGNDTTGDSDQASTTTNPPRMLVADGSYPRWASDESEQCQWDSEQGPPESNNLFLSGTKNGPNVRVLVCVTGSLETNCKSYAGDVKKPTGLLQEYGEDGDVRFGLISGSYENRDKGGVLRRNIGQLAGNADTNDDEINADGTFTGYAGIISTLNKIRINEWSFTNKIYNDCNTPGISKDSYLTSADTGVQCSNWGNPIGEIYLESLRYLAGAGSPTASFSAASDPLSLTEAAWSDPMGSTEWCAPMNIVVLSSSDNSFDTDDLSSVSDTGIDLTTATNAIGGANGENYSGNIFIGSNGTTSDDKCSVKSFTSLSSLKGICPSAPSMDGGYHIAGMAHKAHTVDMRDDRVNDPVTGEFQTVDTFVVALSKELPELTFKVGDGLVKVIPTFGAHSTNEASLYTDGWRTGSLANIVVTQTEQDLAGNLTYARLLILWEDSPWGYDYDKDGIAQLAICVGAECAMHDDDANGISDNLDLASGQIRVTNRVVDGASGDALRFGFIVSGTTADGEYSNVLRPGDENGSVLDANNNPTKIRPDETNWSDPDVRFFSAGSTAARLLDNPLVLAAKYGGFIDSDASGDTGEGWPDKTAEWDNDSDGTPDNYFLADNPTNLGVKLGSFFSSIATESSSSSVVANSGSLDDGTRLYQARFDSSNWSGQLLALPVNPDTAEVADPTAAVDAIDDSKPDWDSGIQITAQDYATGREILTWDADNSTGIAFRWDSLSGTPLETALNLNPITLTSDGLGEDRLEYLRGNTAKEIRNSGGHFRNRGLFDDDGTFVSEILGDTIHSSPVLVAEPNSGYLDDIEASAYSTFVSTNASRTPMVYFGANDGMLHGVSEVTGDEKIAFIPNALFGDGSTTAPLNELTSTNYQHRYYVDGGITVNDAYFDSAWHTVLVGALGAGGKAVFALDITDPSSFDETNAGSLVLWEMTDTDLTDTDPTKLGYTFSHPTIFKADGEGWIAAFGNGYGSANGGAYLYLIDIDGSATEEITLDATGPNNGLSSISPIDSDNDGDIDIIYAGDLLGNVWKLTSSNGFANNTVERLFTAKADSTTVQPITTRIEVGIHPQGRDGRMVYFGTGKYYETTDNDPANAVSPNTMYGIWDDDSNNPTVSSTTDHTQDGSLVKQTITEHTGSLVNPNGETIGYNLRTVTDHPVDWETKNGWYIDLPTTGEKVVVNPTLRGGRIIFITTIPSTSPCESGGISWLMEVDHENGGQLDVAAFDLNHDGVFDIADYLMITDDSGNTSNLIPVGKQSKSGILQSPAILFDQRGKTEYKYSSGSKGGVIERTTENPVPFDKGRKSWLHVGGGCS